MIFNCLNWFSTLGLIIVILLTVDGRPRSRSRRQSNLGFRVIANSSFPCTSATTTVAPATSNDSVEASSRSKPLSLTWDEITNIMERAHVSNDGKLTAMTAEETQNFPNLIPLANEYKLIVKQLLNVDPNGILLKSEVMHYLEFMDAIATDLPSTDNVRRKRDASSNYVPFEHSDKSTQEYCYARGTPTADHNYLYMCTVCSKTRDLGDGFWPRYVNEAECHETDNHCLVVQEDSFHGKCQSIILPLNILERKEGYCALALKDGQTVVVEDWQPTTEVIKVGCECTVDADSVFAYFV